MSTNHHGLTSHVYPSQTVSEHELREKWNAQAVMDAAYALPLKNGQPSIAAALRAAADQVVPEAAEAVGDQHDDARLDQWLRIRWKLLAIATELDGHHG